MTKTLITSNIFRFIALVLILISSLFIDKINPDLFPPGSNIEEVLGIGSDNQVPASDGLVGPYQVTKVIDGDTIQISTGDKVRYIGMDTPESTSQAGIECFGPASSEANKNLLSTGRNQIWLEKDVSETDRYGRLLRYVYIKRTDNNIENFVMVNWELVRTGYANASTYPPDVKYQLELKEAESEARTENLGLWTSCK